MNKELWFTESALPFASQDVRISIRATDLIYRKKSKFALIEVYNTPFFGKVLVIDGIINIADRTEFIYHEMMVILPSIYHGNPKKILIIGGGDGGAAKHALNVTSIESITQIEIDQDVIDVCQKFLPEISEGALRNRKVKLIVGDGVDYLNETRDKFDIIVLDISDPVPGGPSEHLLTEKFYRDVKRSLNNDGVVLTHCGSLIFQTEKSKLIVDNLQKIFKYVTMHLALVPEFELTEFGFLVCSDASSPNNREVVARFQGLINAETQYLDEDVYFSSKIIPRYIQKLSGVSNS